ncbi:MAG TPA: hypothetical protein VHN37_10750 [Actinomycetota bacterium]|nr:hypothetical protein [Actinomycetota bacterium]
MKRSVASLAVVVALVAGPAVRPAGAGSKTTVLEQRYEAPAVGVMVGTIQYVNLAHDCEDRIGCVTFDLGGRYRWAQVEIEDDSGLTARAEVPTVRYGEVCGKTSYPLKVEGLQEVSFIMMPGVCADEETPSTPTSGTVEVTLARSLAALGVSK